VLTLELRRKLLDTGRVVIDNCTPSDRAPQIVDLARAADAVIVSLFVRPPMEGQAIALPATGAAILNQLLEGERPVIVVAFGSPYLLLDYPAIDTYLCAFGDAGDSVLSQQAVARALLGEEPILGKLPVALPGLYPRGHGIPVGTKSTNKN
jgi:hypothetical protein